MMRPAIEWQDRGEAFYFIADYHALTTVLDPQALRVYSAEWRSIFSHADSIRRKRFSSVNAMCRVDGTRLDPQLPYADADAGELSCLQGSSRQGVGPFARAFAYPT